MNGNDDKPDEELTEEQLEELAKDEAPGELSDGDLDAVAGGSGGKSAQVAETFRTFRTFHESTSAPLQTPATQAVSPDLATKSNKSTVKK